MIDTNIIQWIEKASERESSQRMPSNKTLQISKYDLTPRKIKILNNKKYNKKILNIILYTKKLKKKLSESSASKVSKFNTFRDLYVNLILRKILLFF